MLDLFLSKPSCSSCSPRPHLKSFGVFDMNARHRMGKARACSDEKPNVMNDAAHFRCRLELATRGKRSRLRCADVGLGMMTKSPPVPPKKRGLPQRGFQLLVTGWIVELSKTPFSPYFSITARAQAISARLAGGYIRALCDAIVPSFPSVKQSARSRSCES